MQGQFFEHNGCPITGLPFYDDLRKYTYEKKRKRKEYKRNLYLTQKAQHENKLQPGNKPASVQG